MSVTEQRLFSLPVRFGGLGVALPTQTADSMYNASRHATTVLVHAIQEAVPFHPCEHTEMVFSARSSYHQKVNQTSESLFQSILPEFDPHRQRAINRAKDNNLAVWLTVLPIAANNFDLTAQEFRDVLVVHYKKPLLANLPHCNGCGVPSSLDRLLSCKKGSLIVQRHNELHDALGNLVALLWGQVRCEPVVSENSVDDEGLVADLGIRGVWSPQSEALCISYTPERVWYPCYYTRPKRS